MNPLKNFTATSCACLALLMLGATQAWAGEAIGSVTQVNGPLLVKRASGAIKALALNSLVERGDVLVSESATYARIKFTDDSEITMRPSTQLKVESYSFNSTGFDSLDNVFSLSKGAVQVRTGMADKGRSGEIKLFVPNTINSSGLVAVKREPGTTFVAEYVFSQESKLALTDPAYDRQFQPGRLTVKAPQRDRVRTHWSAQAVPSSIFSRISSAMDVSKLAVLLSPFAGSQIRPLAVFSETGSHLNRMDLPAPLRSTLTQAFSRTVEPLFKLQANKFGVQLAQGPSPARATPPSLPPGLYVQVIDGLIQLSNRGGVQQFAAGQFGFTGSVVQPPVIVPNNPGIQFNPPPAFSSSSGPQSGTTSGSKPKTVDCEVR